MSVKAFIEQQEYDENLFKISLSQGVTLINRNNNVPLRVRNLLWTRKCKNTLQTLFCSSPVFFTVDEKTMIRNRYNRIPNPSSDTIRERNTNKSRRHKNNSTIGKPKGQLFLSRCLRGYLKHNEQILRLTESGRTNTIRINHNRSTALEPSVINY